jgi:hypothetical protein
MGDICKSVPIIAASTRLTALFPGFGTRLTGARPQALVADDMGAELSQKLPHDVGLSMMRRSF